MSDWVELGRIGGPFGIKGWLHVQSFTDPPEALLGYGRWSLEFGRDRARIERKVLEGRAQGRGLVARLEGVDDRDAAAALRGARIEVARAELPAPGPRRFYRADLIGLRVRNLEGVELGVVRHFVDAPANAVMVVAGATQHWIPAIPRHVRSVDLDSGSIVVDWPGDLE
ncbi:MAG TPA: ribosome maturation factor RimM [Steroidobacteraceae bacterium]|nr:ribosome maturation factor RimM [Steroidobacteraceae bacterium]